MQLISFDNAVVSRPRAFTAVFKIKAHSVTGHFVLNFVFCFKVNPNLKLCNKFIF